jgi:short subunit dehydrogenase-like uncharacterized protein
MKKNYDVVVWGATGFTGGLVAEYLMRQYGLSGALRWAIAGRNPAKLEALKQAMQAGTLPIIKADSLDRSSLDRMVAQTQVVCSCTGPYALYGTDLVAACVEGATDYCDLSGEVQWMRRMVDQYHEAARQQGVKIVHSCGFDSIPSDMGVFFLQQQALERYGSYCKRIHFRLTGSKGGFSGGTYASLSNVQVEAEQDSSITEILADPYALNPPGERQGPDQADLDGVAYDPVAQAYIAPFVMASINTRNVRRSHALAAYPYGKDFRYDEAALTGKGWQGRIAAGVLAWGMGLIMSARPGSLRKRLLNRLLPKPGEGPDQKTRENGYFKVRFYGELANGELVRASVKGKQDPGYGSTSKMLGESAVCLALDVDSLPDRSGVLTPATAMGGSLLARLQANAGLTFEMQSG